MSVHPLRLPPAALGVPPEVRMGERFPLWRGAVAAAATYFVARNFADVQASVGLAVGAFFFTYQWQAIRIPGSGRLPRYPASNNPVPGRAPYN